MPGNWMDAGADSISYTGSGATSGANVTSGGAVKPQLKVPGVSAAGPTLRTSPPPHSSGMYNAVKPLLGNFGSKPQAPATPAAPPTPAPSQNMQKMGPPPFKPNPFIMDTAGLASKLPRAAAPTGNAGSRPVPPSTPSVGVVDSALRGLSSGLEAGRRGFQTGSSAALGRPVGPEYTSPLHPSYNWTGDAPAPLPPAPQPATQPPVSTFDRGMGALHNSSTALQNASGNLYLGAGAGYLANKGYRMAVPSVTAASGIPTAAQAAPAGWQAGGAAARASRAASPLGRAVTGTGNALRNISGLSALQPAKFGAPVTMGSRALGVAGKLNAGSNAAYGAYALGDVARSGYNLATGKESLGGIQNDAMGRGYLGNVEHNLSRPGQAAIALGDSAIDTAINTPRQAIRGRGLDRQINSRQNQAAQSTQQAMQLGMAGRQQLNDAFTALKRDHQTQTDARRYRPWLWNL